MVTGVGPGCNSTAVAAQTALALARMGRVAILVTADHDVIASLARRFSPGTLSSRAPRRCISRDAPPGLLLVGEWDGDGVAAAKLTNLLPELHDRMPEAVVVIDGPSAWQSAGMALRADKILLVVAPGRSSRASAAAGAGAGPLQPRS